MQKYLRRLTSLTLALLMAFSLVSYIEVSADEITDCFDVMPSSGWSSTPNAIDINTGGTYTITQNCAHSASEHENYQISIGGSITVELTIKDVQISNPSDAAMYIFGSATVTLILEGTNTFDSSDANGNAGIEFNDATGSLEITSTDENATLTAKGGYNSAGIGSGSTGAFFSGGHYANNITISGGTVYAYGGYGGAGIGSGTLYTATNITISGGTVYAYGGDSGAGIGGGAQGPTSNIIISGGTVTATGGDGADDIGNGAYTNTLATIIISGGSVKADFSTTPINSGDATAVNVYKATIFDASDVSSVIVDDLIDYNITSNHQGDDNLYLYLTGDSHTVTVNTVKGNTKYQVTWDGYTQTFTVVKILDAETSTEGSTGSTSSGVIIADTSTK